MVDECYNVSYQASRSLFIHRFARTSLLHGCRAAKFVENQLSGENMRRVLALLIASVTLAQTSCQSLQEAAADENWDSANLGDGGTSAFYSYSDDLHGEPGVLLRQEELGERQSNPGASRNLRLLYSSTDGLTGEDLVAVSGALFLPEGTPPEGGWPLMAWTHGTVGIADICSPSWDGRQQQDKDYLEFWLKQGFAVVASDYQGLGTPGIHPYLATRPEAYSNLDIIRAALAAGLSIANNVVLIGQSQGAGAAVATAAFAPGYAPELDIRGVVATGVPYFSPEALIALNESRPPDQPDPLLGYNFLAMTLAEQIVPGFVMREHVSDEAWPIASLVTDTCYNDIKTRVQAEGLSQDRAFSKSPTGALTTAFEQMGFPTVSFDTPIFLGTGGKDRDTPARMQAAFMRDACKAGSTIEAHLYPELNHRQVVPGSTRESLRFVRAAFEGRVIQGNCNASPFGS